MFVRTINGNADSIAYRALAGREWPGGVDWALPLNTAGLYLADDVLGVLDLSCDAGYTLTRAEMGYPQVRGVAWNRALADGTFDSTRFVGARVFTLAVGCDGSVRPLYELVDRLRAFVYPRYRPWLCWLPEGASEVRRCRVRGVDAPLLVEDDQWVDMALQFVSAGDASLAGGSGAGLVESAVEQCRAIRPGAVDEPGRVYDLVFDRVYPPAGVAGAVQIVNAGNAPAEWTATIQGPAINPVLYVNDMAMHFNTTLVEGDALVISSAGRTIRSGNGESRYHTWDFAAGAWWPVLNPGTNLVRWTADEASTSTVSVLDFCWRSSWA